MRILTAQRCSPSIAELGEGVFWDAVRRELFWVDILAGRLHRARIEEGELLEKDALQIDRHLGAAVPVADGDGRWLLAAGQGFGLLRESGDFTVLAEPEAGQAGVMRMNDGACDPQGRFWAGSMAYNHRHRRRVASLYRVDLDGRVDRMLSEVTISNGLGWSPDGGLMYFVDTPTRAVDVFDFAGSDGSIANRRHLVVVPEGQGWPDGLCLDDDGHLWVALWGGGAVQRYDPAGRLEARVELSATQPTRCCFGGDDASTLYISTARAELDATALAATPDAGAVFAVVPGVTGPAVTPFRGAATTLFWG